MDNSDTKKISNNELLEAINRSFSRIEDKMATKTDLDDFKNETYKRFDNIETDLKSFKTETRERFDNVDESVKELNENVNAVIEDYHPRIEALEEKVFGNKALL